MKKVIYLTLLILLIGVLGWFGWQFYQKNSWRLEPSLVEIGTADSSNKNAYNLEFIGMFVSLNDTDRILTLRGNDSKEYHFLVPASLLSYGDMDVMNLTVGQDVDIKWKDVRTMEQVKADYSKDPSKTLNAEGDSISIIGLNDESAN